MLHRLFSDTGLLVENVIFHPGINIVYGKYSVDKEARGINGIGKSSLIRLIDYMLLSDTAEREFNKSKYDFLRDNAHTLTLEFDINHKRATIRRSFENNNLIEFGYTPYSLSEYTRQELIDIFWGLFFPAEDNKLFIEGNRYRTLMQFYIKDDIQSKTRKDATNFFNYNASAVEKSILNFYLLGLPVRNLFKFNEVNIEYNSQSNTKKMLEEKLREETGKSLEEYKTERLKIEDNISVLRKQIESYNFKHSHIEIESRLASIVEKINEKSKSFHTLSNKLKNIKASYQSEVDIDTKHIQKIYNEVIENFGNLVRKSLDDILQFKNDIIENRNKFLFKKESEIEVAIEKVLAELTDLELQRSNIMKQVSEKGILSRLENTYEALILEKSSLERQSQMLLQIDQYNETIATKDIELSEVRRDVIQDLQQVQQSLNKLRSLFMEILNSAIFVDEKNSNGYFDILINVKGKKTTLPFKLDINVPKSGSMGQEVLKTLTYDLMIFFNAINEKRELPDFLIHDGVFHDMSHKTMVNLLNYIYNKHILLKTEVGRDFQYIVTFSEDEIEVPTNKRDLYGQFNFIFNDKKILEIEDTPDKMLFKRDIRE